MIFESLPNTWAGEPFINNVHAHTHTEGKERMKERGKKKGKRSGAQGGILLFRNSLDISM